MSKVIGALIIIGMIAGVFFILQEKWAEKHGGFNPHVQQLTPLLRMHVAKSVGGEDRGAGESSFMTIVYLAHKASTEGHGLAETVKQAATATGASPGEATRIAIAVNENVNFARSMGVFKESNNELAMERGDPPIATIAGWEGEPIVVGHTLSPVLAPEAAFAIPNLRLMPECLRDMQNERVTPATVELARKWLLDQIIYPDTKKAIDEKAREAKLAR